MRSFKINDFIFSARLRVARHIFFWFMFTLLTSLLYAGYSRGIWSVQRQFFLGLFWLPPRILYCYPLMYLVIPKFLLRGKYVQFGIIVLVWFIAGFFLNFIFRAYFFIPIQKALHVNNIVTDPWMPGSFLLLTTVAGLTSIIVLFKYWFRKQQELLQAEKEKVTAELQLLKAQVHPHFLFNTLNNIYSFSLENSPKTPGLVLKLSSLLSYMLYDCSDEKVLLEKEIEVMKNYIDLEKERYGNRIEISSNIEGDIKDKFIAPLLLLPFLENAFKHGTSEQLERPWLSFDLAVRRNIMKCKIVNSKNELIAVNEKGIGIENVKKRLTILYPDKHEIRLTDEKNFFVVSLVVELEDDKVHNPVPSNKDLPVVENISG